VSFVAFIKQEEKKLPTGTCPECEADVHVDTDTDKGDTITCEECGTELEVVGLDPVELDIAEDDVDEDEEEEDF
jgi:alpha-aminoadipate carrier protein LysW